ncbi:Hypothetical protein NTJ_04298 [Nesidiocoris tenuis]|uniref:Uncharacterized protein n=1 Tax=Nesidiocoris tenuis TaxID=355587 RepID=A0ABN7AGV2_9HEMI|nr:Hypothetical protein NTJ_04298 [Nesidiocoris tenuis]
MILRTGLELDDRVHNSSSTWGGQVEGGGGPAAQERGMEPGGGTVAGAEVYLYKALCTTSVIPVHPQH